MTAPETLRDLLTRLDGLDEKLRQRRNDVTELEQSLGLNPGAAPPKATPQLAPAHARAFSAWREALPKARQQVADIEAEMAQTRTAIERERAAAAKRPMSAGELKTLDMARAYIASAAEVQRKAEALAVEMRVALELGELLGARLGTDHSRRLFALGVFRQRITAGLSRLFERTAETEGLWNSHGALLELGDSKRASQIARLGFAAHERSLVQDIIPENLKGAL